MNLKWREELDTNAKKALAASYMKTLQRLEDNILNRAFVANLWEKTSFPPKQTEKPYPFKIDV